MLAMAAVVAADLRSMVNRPPPPPVRVTRHVVRDGWIGGAVRGADGAAPRLDEHAQWSVFLRHQPMTPAELDALVIAVAFNLEIRARRFFSGHGFAGARGSPGVTELEPDACMVIQNLLYAHKPGPEARGHLDRALAWFAAALAAGLQVTNGREAVTEELLRLQRFAVTRPAIDVAEHGVTIETTEEVHEGIARPVEMLRVVRILALTVGVIALFPLLGGPKGPGPGSCAERRASTLEYAARLQERTRDPGQLEALPRVIAAVRAGEVAEARALWEPVKGDAATGDPGAMLGVELFLLEACRP